MCILHMALFTVRQKIRKKNTRLEQVFAQNLRSENWRDGYNAAAARLWGSVSRRSPRIYPNNKPLLSLPLPSSASRPTQFLIRISLLRNCTAFLERRKGQEYCARGDWKLELNWLPSRINQTQGLEQRAPTPSPDSLVIPPSRWVSLKIPKRRNYHQSHSSSTSNSSCSSYIHYSTDTLFTCIQS